LLYNCVQLLEIEVALSVSTILVCYRAESRKRASDRATASAERL